MRTNDPDVMFDTILNMAIDVISTTAGDASYRLLLAAADLAYTTEMQRQLANTARFIGSDPVCRKCMDYGKGRYKPEDFTALSLRLAREYVSFEMRDKAVAEGTMQPLEPGPLRSMSKDEIAAYDLDWERTATEARAARHNRPREYWEL